MLDGDLLDDAHAELAVVEQQRVPRLDRLEDLRVRQKHALGPCRASRRVEAEDGPCRQLDAPAVEIADAELGALQIGEDADRMAMARRAGAHGCSSALAPSCDEWLMLMRKTSTPAIEETLDHFRGG